MDNMMFILGSGIMEDPTIFRFSLFFSMSIFLCLLSFVGLRKADNDYMFVLTCVFAIGCMVSFFFSAYYLTKLLSEEKTHHPRVEKMEYENHQFLIFREKLSFDVVHDPECECRKLSRSGEE